MSDRVLNVLFLCTHNSARSVIGECIINSLGRGNFKGFSAGSRPRGAVNPYALELLQRLNYDVSHLRSKSWEEFAAPGAPKLDFVFTVCDDAANETCPAWPGQPMTAHWGVEDPAAYAGPAEKQERLFRDVYFQLERRIQIFINLPIASLDRLTLQRRLDDIGQARSAAPAE
jgi:protein-tyrosine-phosphatase